MKKALTVLALSLFIIQVNAQTMQTGDEKKSKPKKHVCTSSCTKENHMYAHGEKGHACKDECKKMEGKSETKMALKDHVCTDACSKNGKCVMAHGEKGHTCGEECKKMK